MKKKKEMESFFNFFAHKHNIICVFPAIFNNQLVAYFNKIGRPVDFNNKDMIENFWKNNSDTTFSSERGIRRFAKKFGVKIAKAIPSEKKKAYMRVWYLKNKERLKKEYQARQ